MTIRDFDGRQPSIADNAWVDESAQVIGDVSLGTDVSVWPTTVLRGDVQRITVGARTNIQDGTVVHVTSPSPANPAGFPTRIGAGVTIGHRAIVHACTVGDYCLIGMGAIIMDGAVLGDRCILGAGALVANGKQLEGGYLYVGSPAKRLRELSEEELAFLEHSADHYVALKNRHAGETG